jgi:hypothetical protein
MTPVNEATHWRQVCHWALADVTQAPGQAKPTQLQPPVLIQQDVGGLEVAVDDGGGVEVLQSLQRRSHRHPCDSQNR